jgi:hypothetical protein
MATWAGRSTRRWRQLKAEQRAKRLPCCICGQRIDYTLQHPDPGSFSVQHKRDWHSHPELREAPANLDSAHLGCNSAAGKDGKLGVSVTSEDW